MHNQDRWGGQARGQPSEILGRSLWLAFSESSDTLVGACRVVYTEAIYVTLIISAVAQHTHALIYSAKAESFNKQGHDKSEARISRIIIQVPGEEVCQ